MLRSALVLAGVLGLAACAVGPREVPDDRDAAWADLRAQLEALESWHAEGRLSVNMSGDGGSAGFDWRERADGRFTLHLAGPWGQGVARLSGDDQRVELDTGEGQVITGADASVLLRDLYGWNIPVAGLRRWLIGLPAADTAEATYTLDRFGRLETLVWDDWEIEYRRHRRVDDLDLPAILRADRMDGEARIRIAVDRWQLREADSGDDDSGVPLIGD